MTFVIQKIQALSNCEFHIMMVSTLVIILISKASITLTSVHLLSDIVKRYPAPFFLYGIHVREGFKTNLSFEILTPVQYKYFTQFSKNHFAPKTGVTFFTILPTSQILLRGALARAHPSATVGCANPFV